MYLGIDPGVTGALAILDDAGERLTVGAIVMGATARDAPTFAWSLSMHPGFLRRRVTATGRVDTFGEARAELRRAFDDAEPDIEGYRAHMATIERAAAMWTAIHRPAQGARQ